MARKDYNGADAHTHLLSLHGALAKHEITGESARWLEKAFHPPFNVERVAIPDESFRPGVRLDLRPSAVISAPPGSTTPWDLCIVTLPGDVNGAVWCAAPAGFDFTGPSTPACVLGILPLQDRDGSPDDEFNISKYPTSDGGPRGTVPVRRSNVSSRPFSFRTTYRSITAHLTASSLNNQGTVTACQVDADWNRGPGLSAISRISAVYTCIPAQTSLPLAESEITAGVPGSAVHEARDGTYMPLRLIGPSQPFVTRGCAYDRTQFGTETSLEYVDFTSHEPLPPTLPHTPQVEASGRVDPNPWPTVQNWILEAYAQESVVDDTNFDRCASSVQIFRGLSPDASVTIRMFCGLEMTIMPTSPFKGFVCEPAPPDQTAINLYYTMVNQMRTVYPAHYNGLSMLVPLLTSAASYLAPKLLPYAEKGIEAGAKFAVKEVRKLLEHEPKKKKVVKKPLNEVALTRAIRATKRAR